MIFMVILVIAYNKYSQFIPTSEEALTQNQTHSLNAVDIQNIRQHHPITTIRVYNWSITVRRL